MTTRCKAFTGRLNCGCCENVEFQCEWEMGHFGEHLVISKEYTRHMIKIMWEYSPCVCHENESPIHWCDPNQPKSVTNPGGYVVA